MRVKIRLGKGVGPDVASGSGGSTSLNRLELPGQDPSLADLKKAVWTHLGDSERSPNADWREVVVSLNGKTPLQSCTNHSTDARVSTSEQESRHSKHGKPDDDAKTSLKSLDVISGDIVWVLHLPGYPRRSNKPEADVGSDSSREICIASSRTDMDIDVEKDLQHSSQSQASVPLIFKDLENILGDDIMRGRVPTSWSQAFVLLFHAAMTGYGFDGVMPTSRILKECRVTETLYRIPYELKVKSRNDREQSVSFVVHVSTMSSSMVLAMDIPQDISEQVVRLFPLTGAAKGDILGLCSKYVFQLMNSWKDDFCQPVLLRCCKILGIEYPVASFMVIPMDVKYKILSWLDFRDLCSIGMTCREMHHVANDNVFWLALCREYFPDQLTSENTIYGQFAAKYAFKRMISIQKERDRERQEMLRFRHTRRMPPQPPEMRPSFPGIIGGDYDRLPSLRPPPWSAGPRNNNRQWRLP
jgi:hypothetical protein